MKTKNIFQTNAVEAAVSRTRTTGVRAIFAMVALLLAMSCGKDDEDMLKDDGQINNDSPLPEPVAEAKKTFEFLQTKGYRGTEMPGRIRGFGKEYIWRVKNKKSG